MAIEIESQEPLLEISGTTPDPSDSMSNTKKRKRVIAEASTKKLKSKKSGVDDDSDYDLEVGVNKAFSNMNSQLLADYVAQRTRKFESDLSSVELEDKYLPVNAIRDTTSWSNARDLAGLPGFLEKFSSNPTKLWSASKMNGAPHTIIVTSSGLRAADLARAVRDFQTKNVKVAKLFAKHIKIQESIHFLNSTRTGIAVGTPTRLKDLMDDGALKTDRIERIVIDASFIDQKKRGMLEMKEIQVPLTLWLGQKVLRERYETETDAIELMFY